MCYDTLHRWPRHVPSRRHDAQRAGDARILHVTLPLPLRNRLAELILESLHDPEARRGLEAVATVCADPRALTHVGELPARVPRDFFEERAGGLQVKSGWKEYAAELRRRSGRAWRAIRDRPLDPADAPLGTILAAAALLFDAGLYYEVHELLEPPWMRAGGGAREALQGLIQIAVGFQHLANGNVAGARGLLADGCAKTLGRRLHGLDLDPFARAARGCFEQVASRGANAAREFDWAAVPRFPTRS